LTSVQHPSLAPPAGTVPALFAGLAGLFAAEAAVTSATALGPVAAWTGLTIYLLAAALALASIGRHGGRSFGWPNGVTLVRLVATALVAGYAAETFTGLRPADGLATSFAMLAGAAILADGLDGWIARRHGPATPFGARFDMEVDALLIAILSALAYGLGKTGAWVLAIGAMRYAFVAAGRIWPWLARPLPPSFRRKAVCVVQGAALVALASPSVSGTPAVAIAAVALGALAWSFLADIAWLAARRPRDR
jgi:phosphatidylglycerophosphate synthase